MTEEKDSMEGKKEEVHKHVAEPHQAESHKAESHKAESHQAESHQAESHKAESHQAEQHNAPKTHPHQAGGAYAEHHAAKDAAKEESKAGEEAKKVKAKSGTTVAAIVLACAIVILGILVWLIVSRVNQNVETLGERTTQQLDNIAAELRALRTNETIEARTAQQLDNIAAELRAIQTGPQLDTLDEIITELRALRTEQQLDKLDEIITELSVLQTGESGKVTVIEYSEFWCPYCFRAESTIQSLKELYGDNVTFEWRHYVVHGDPATHTGSALPAEASECARDQGKFDEMKAALFSAYFEKQLNTGNVTILEQLASEIGLDAATFKECLDGGSKASKVSADTASAHNDGVTGTPAFLICGEIIKGAQPINVFQEKIDAVLLAGGCSPVGDTSSKPATAMYYISNSEKPSILLSSLVSGMSALGSVDVTTTFTESDAEARAAALNVSAWPVVVVDVGVFEAREDVLGFIQAFAQENAETLVSRPTDDGMYYLFMDSGNIAMFHPPRIDAIYYNASCAACGTSLDGLVVALKAMSNVSITVKDAKSSRAELEAQSVTAYPVLLIDFEQSRNRVDVFSRIVGDLTAHADSLEGTVNENGIGIISTATKMEFISGDATLSGSGVTVNMYVMSHCPYGTLAEDSMKAVYDALNGSVKFRPVFIGEYDPSTNEFSSMHGAAEVLDDMRQACIYDAFGSDAWFKYTICYNGKLSSGVATDAAHSQCITNTTEITSASSVETCVNGDTGIALLAENADETATKGVSSSPTLVISAANAADGTSMSTSVSNYRDTNGVKNSICGMYAVAGTAVPEECGANTTLASNTAAASGSCG